jgi:hypothetical protein
MKSYNVIFCLIMAMFFTFSYPVLSQTDSTRNDALHVFISCSVCDMDFIRDEITFVNYVRDRNEAQVFLLITSRYTGSGGEEYTVFFIGQQEFKGQLDTFYFTTSPDDTEDIIRDKMLKPIKYGLIRYVAKTPLINDISISYDKNDSIAEVKDKWNSWVFSISSYGNASFEKLYQNFNISSSFAAEKVTEDFKTEFYLSNYYSESRYLIDEDTFKSISRSYYFSNQSVFSLSDHWSAGFSAGISSSVYSNLKYSHNIGPAVEYNLFPYSESTRRQCTFKYTPKYAYRQYFDTTIFNKIDETLFMHSLGIAYQTIQTWGNINLSISGSQYFHDFSKKSLSFSVSSNIRIIKGLSFYCYSSFSIVHNQLSLPKYDATSEEILLRIRELESQYDFYAYAGLSYTFGSIYNNVVNPRFGD